MSDATITFLVLTALFGQAISKMATALIVVPIALAAAHDLGVSTKPVLMRYRFGDYWRLGLVMLGVFFAVAVGLVPLIWRF